MKIKMLAISEENIKTYPKIISVLLNSLINISETPIGLPPTFPDVKSALSDIANSLKECDVLFVLTTAQTYLSAKDDLAKAFRFTMQVNEQTNEKIKSNQNSDMLKAHAMLPANSIVYSLSDGLYSSFVIRSKSQSIIFMPICEDRTFITMKKCIFPFFDKYYGTECTNFLFYETDYASVILRNAIGDKGIKFAMANTPIFKQIQKTGIAASAINAYTESVPYLKESNVTDYEEFTLMKAVAASEFLECRFGGAIVTEETDSKDDFRVHIAIVNDSQTMVKTISSVPDESFIDFLQTVTTEFLLSAANLVSRTKQSSAKQQTDKTGVNNADDNAEIYESVEDMPVTPAIGAWKPILYAILIAAACGLTYYAVELVESGALPFFG